MVTPDSRWFKYDRDYLCVNKSQFVPVIFEPPCICGSSAGNLLRVIFRARRILRWPLDCLNIREPPIEVPGYAVAQLVEALH
jgi:hypothetical protein